MIYLLTVTGESGKQYSLMFDCDEYNQAVTMCRDCLNGVIEGELVEVITLPDDYPLEKLH